MPFFKVTTISKIEKEVLVEAENMSSAVTKTFDAIRDKRVPIPYKGLYFEEAHAVKMPDTMTLAEANALHEAGVAWLK
jgi:hypothetical protein